MSVATKRYVSSYGNNRHTDEMAQRPQSPAPNYLQHQSKMNGPFPSQESNLKRPSPADDEGDHRDKRQKTEGDSDRMDIDSSIQVTNHERQRNAESAISLDPNTETTTSESQDKKDILPAHPAMTEGGRAKQEAFLLCTASVPRSRPDPNRHLLSMYGLSDLLRSVARTDPFTGEKINKLRKSYEGQIKTFGLAGRNRAEKADREGDEPGPLRRLAMVPDVKWSLDQGKNKIEANEGFREKLKVAMQIQPGIVRKNAEWEDILGHEKPRPNVPLSSNITPTSALPNSARIPNGLPRAMTGGSTDKRATRGKKRSYGDESFVGYGEGYSDMDDDVEDGDDGMRRKRKKDSFGQSSR